MFVVEMTFMFVVVMMFMFVIVLENECGTETGVKLPSSIPVPSIGVPPVLKK